MIGTINSFINRGGRIIILLLSMFISILISRLYGVEVVGQYTYLMTTITILVLLISFGTNQSMLANFSKETLKELISTNIKLYLITFLGIFVMVIVLYNLGFIFQGKEFSFIFLILSLSFLQAISNIFKNKFIVEDKIYLYYYFDILQYTLLIVGISLFYFFGYKKIAYMLLAIYTLFSALVLWINRRDICFSCIVKIVIKKEYFGASLLTFISALFLTLSYKYNVFLFESDFPKSILGYYAIVMFLIDGVTLFLTSVMFADINKFKDAGSDFLIRYTAKFLLVAMVAIFIIDLTGERVLEMIYDVKTSELTEMLSIMKYSIGIVLILKIVQNYFIMNKQYRYYLYNSILFIVLLWMMNHFYTGTFQDVLYNYIISLFLTTIFAIILYMKSRVKVLYAI